MVFGRSKGSIQTSVIVEQPPTTAAEEEEPPILGGLSIQHSGSRLQQSYNVGTGGSSIDGGDKNSGGESLRIIGNHDADDEETIRRKSETKMANVGPTSPAVTYHPITWACSCHMLRGQL